jgi:hypothetical protein
MALGMVVLRLLAKQASQSRWLIVLRFVVGIGSVCLLALPLHAKIQWVMPLLPLTLIRRPEADGDPATLFPRLFVTTMAATVFLGTYPVAGSQIGVAAVPMILWAYLCISDGIEDLTAASRGSVSGRLGGLRLDAVVGGVILLVFGGTAAARSGLGQLPPATELRGSTWLHLPKEQASQFASIAGAVSTNCSMLFTMPELGSFNLWSGVPTPNGWNQSAWMIAFSLERQAEIMEIIQADERACVLVNMDILRKTWGLEEATIAIWPLAHYIVPVMPVTARYGDYEIHVHPHRSSPWAGTGDQGPRR